MPDVKTESRGAGRPPKDGAKPGFRGKGRPPKDGSKDHLKPAPKREPTGNPRGRPKQ